MAAVKTNFDQVLATVKRLHASMLDASQPLKNFGEHMTLSYRDRFDTETSPTGEKWAQNSEVTLLRYTAKKQGSSKGLSRRKKGVRALAVKKILQDEHHLINPVYQVTDNKLMFGTNEQTTEYAAMMHFGGKKSTYSNLWGDIPARPFLGATTTDKDILKNMLTTHLEDQWKIFNGK